MAISTRLVKTEVQGPPATRHWTDYLGALLLFGLAGITLLALVLPTIITIMVSFDDSSFIRFPPQTFSFVQYTTVFQNKALIDSAVLSIAVALIVVVIDLVLGIPASIALVRTNFRGKSLLYGFLQSPLMIPGIVVGISILFFVSFAKVRISIPLMILSHVVVTIPFVIRITTARFESADKSLEDAARNLRANRWQVFQHVQLPHLMPGIIGGAAFAFLVSFDNLPVSLFTAPPLDPPLPIYLFRAMIYKVDPWIGAVATIQILGVFLLMGILSRTVGTMKFVGGQ